MRIGGGSSGSLAKHATGSVWNTVAVGLELQVLPAGWQDFWWAHVHRHLYPQAEEAVKTSASVVTGIHGCCVFVKMCVRI